VGVVEGPRPSVCRTWGGSVCGVGLSKLKIAKGFSKPNAELGPELDGLVYSLLISGPPGSSGGCGLAAACRGNGLRYCERLGYGSSNGLLVRPILDDRFVAEV
jgi:hypothetical protein